MDFVTDHGISRNGFYRGKVLKLDSAGGGRCKIFVPGVFPNEFYDAPDKLPTAEQAAPLFGGGSMGDGTFSYPHVGSNVWVFFENGDQNRPVYFAAMLDGGLARQDPNRGFSRITSGDESYTHMVSCGKARIIVKENGQIQIDCKEIPTPNDSESDEPVEGEAPFAQIQLDSDSGAVIIESSSSITLKAPTVVIDASSIAEVNTTTLNLKASDAINSQTKLFNNVSTEQFVARSPTIEMDASQGTFTAKPKVHSPLFLT